MNLQDGLAAAYRSLGKGPGFAIFAYLIGGGLLLLTARGIDVAPLTGPLGALCAAYFGGGAIKIAAEARDGNSGKTA